LNEYSVIKTVSTMHRNSGFGAMRSVEWILCHQNCVNDAS